MLAFALAHLQEGLEGGFEGLKEMRAEFFGVCGIESCEKDAGEEEQLFCGECGMVVVVEGGLELGVETAVVVDEFKVEAWMAEQFGVVTKADRDFGSAAREGVLQMLSDEVFAIVEERREADLDIVVAVVDAFDLDDQGDVIDTAFCAAKASHAVDREGGRRPVQ